MYLISYCRGIPPNLLAMCLFSSCGIMISFMIDSFKFFLILPQGNGHSLLILEKVSSVSSQAVELL